MGRKKLTVTRTLESGKRIRFKVPDKGAVGLTPKKDRWYEPGIETGWSKNQTANYRRRLVLKAHKNYLAAGRSLQALANVTTDKTTKILAGRDARYFFRKHKNNQM
jgi:hypothetical protein